MINWYKKVVFENYANFNGRARRSEYWYYTLASVIISIVLTILDSVLGLKIGSSDSGILSSIYSLAVIVPGLAVATRRIHDIGKSGWIIVIVYAIMIVAAVVLVVGSLGAIAGQASFGLAMILPILVILALAIYMLVLFCTNGDNGQNEYGPDPKAEGGQEINEIGVEQVS